MGLFTAPSADGFGTFYEYIKLYQPSKLWTWDYDKKDKKRENNDQQGTMQRVLYVCRNLSERYDRSRRTPE